MTRLLLVEDNRADARLFAELLAEVPQEQFVLTTVDTLASALQVAASHDVVFLDLSLPDAHGLSTLTAMVGAARATPIVVLTGNDDNRIAVDAVKAGAQDYLRKAEITPSLITRTAWYAIERKKAVENAQRLALSDEAGRRAHFISGVAAAISASLELDVILRGTAPLLVPTIADFCVIDLMHEDGSFHRVAHGVADERLDATVRTAYEYPPGPKNPRHPALAAVATQQTVVVASLDLASHSPDQQYETVVASLAFRSMMVTPLIARGRVLGAVTYVMGSSDRVFDHDIRLLAEEVAQRLALGIDNAQLYEAAQRAVRARDELIAVVSHDLRNPLNVVALALQMIESDPKTLEKSLPRAKRGVDRMQRLIADLLDVARIETGTLAVELKPIELAAVLDDAYEQHRPLAADRSITLVRDYDGPTGVAIADRHRLGQAIANLIGNALKFTPKGGTIRLGAEACGERLAVVVSDTGPGIAPGHLTHIFDRFWQPERSRDGVGLGLAIVKGIVDAHGGSVTVASTLGQGATFRIELNASGAPAMMTGEHIPLVLAGR